MEKEALENLYFTIFMVVGFGITLLAMFVSASNLQPCDSKEYLERPQAKMIWGSEVATISICN